MAVSGANRGVPGRRVHGGRLRRLPVRRRNTRAPRHRAEDLAVGPRLPAGAPSTRRRRLRGRVSVRCERPRGGACPAERYAGPGTRLSVSPLVQRRWRATGGVVRLNHSSGQPASTVGIWDLARPDEPVRTVDITGLTDVALSSDGRRVYVGTDDPPSLAIYEVESGRKLTSVSIPAGAIEISPSGTLLAVANGRDVVLLDAATLAPSMTLRGHAETVGALRFSHDGALLASTSQRR